MERKKSINILLIFLRISGKRILNYLIGDKPEPGISPNQLFDSIQLWLDRGAKGEILPVFNDAAKRSWDYSTLNRHQQNA